MFNPALPRRWNALYVSGTKEIALSEAAGDKGELLRTCIDKLPSSQAIFVVSVGVSIYIRWGVDRTSLGDEGGGEFNVHTSSERTAQLLRISRHMNRRLWLGTMDKMILQPCLYSYNNSCMLLWCRECVLFPQKDRWTSGSTEQSVLWTWMI